MSSCGHCWSYLRGRSRKSQPSSDDPQSTERLTQIGNTAEVRVPKLSFANLHDRESDSVKIKIESPQQQAEPAHAVTTKEADPAPEEALAFYHAAQAHNKGGPLHSALKHSIEGQQEPYNPPEAECSVVSVEDSNTDKLAPLGVRGGVQFGSDPCCADSEEASQLHRRSTSESIQQRRRSTAESSTTSGFRRTSSINKRVSFTGMADNQVRVPHRIDSKRRQEVSMKKIVDTLYKKVLDDPQLAPFFKGISIERIKAMQTSSMSMAFGGETPYSSGGPDLRQVHMHLIRDEGLCLRHWELWVKYFQETLDELKEIPEEQRENALRCVRATRHYFKPLHAKETPRSSLDVGKPPRS